MESLASTSGMRWNDRGFASKKSNAVPGQPPGTALFVDSCSAFVTAMRRNDCFSPATPEGGTVLAEASCRFVISRSRIHNRCGGQKRFLLRRAGRGGGRNARATSRAVARFWKFFPTAILFQESPPATGSAAIIQQAQELSRFAEPTLIQIVAPGNTKTFLACEETVDDETSLWKPEEN